MPALKSARDQFYYYFEQDKGKLQCKPLYILVHADPDGSGFFELCKKFCDIALNAKKFKDDKGNLQGYFQYEDSDRAKRALKEYCSVNGITEYDKMLDDISLMYPYAHEWDDKRATSYKDMQKINPLTGGFGTYYQLNRIPDDAWKSIRQEVLDFLTEE